MVRSYGPPRAASAAGLGCGARRRLGRECRRLLLARVLAAIVLASRRAVHREALALRPPIPRPPSGAAAVSRRQVGEGLFAAASAAGTLFSFGAGFSPPARAASSREEDSRRELAALRSSLLRAREQLASSAPGLLRAERWDSVRTLLSQPPLRECWTAPAALSGGTGGAAKRAGMLQSYASLLGESGGDELEALELRESLVSHLRYLDMAAYNNVFNPITVQGTAGASAELVRSYYEDPAREYEASLSALQRLIDLSDALVR